MASKNYKRNNVEKLQHDRAVKVRKMTDEQLCKYLDSLKQEKPSKEREKLIIDDFIDHVYSQPCNGIGRATIFKLKAELDNYCVM